MDLSYSADYLEVEPLKLTAAHFPLPGSLRELVLKRYADPGVAGSGMQPMDVEELVGYLCNTDKLELSPMQSVLAQTEAIGDPALPTEEHTAILQWAGEAFDSWEREFPLAAPLDARLRRLKPLAASLAIIEPGFLTPGAHPLHQILDNLHLAAIGWHGKLARAGQAVESFLTNTVEEALTWFDARDTDLAALAARVAVTTERDLARSDRMVQRMMEAEEGRIKTAEARRVAARMINAALQLFPAPAGIGKFLTGPWYDSAQLVLLKFGQGSPQWAQMSATTTALLDSIQTREDEEKPGSRQQLFETVTQLPRELRRWLLSLQHDGDAVGNALAVVEYAHMQILRKRPLELEQTDLIPVTESGGPAAMQDGLDSASPGQWFSIEGDDGNPLRARLASRMEAEGQLLFANQAGIKVLQQSFEEFARLRQSGKVTSLDSGLSFSRSLARAAGIECVADLDSLLTASVMQARREEEERRRLEQEEQRLEQERIAQLAREQEELLRQQEESEQAARREQQREQQREQAQQVALEEQEAQELQREWDEAQRLKLQRMQAEASPTAAAGSAPAPEVPTTGKIPAGQQPDGIIPTPGPARPVSPATASPALKLPMGAWLGFHDGDTPLLAKLAVHDLERDNYIFVNRSGIKMRDLNSADLLRLIENGLVDILETRSNFRDQITQAKNKSED